MTKTWRSLVGLALAAAAACSTDNITDTNRNPNNPTSAPPGALFANATVTSVRRWVSFGGTAILTQQFSSVLYPTLDSYISLQADGTSGSFTSAYTGDLSDFRQVILAGKQSSQAGIYGPAMVMQTWDFSNLTSIGEGADTMVTVNSTPLLYQFFFNDALLYPAYNATFAMRGASIGLQGFSIDNVYDYYQSNSTG